MIITSACCSFHSISSCHFTKMWNQLCCCLCIFLWPFNVVFCLTQQRITQVMIFVILGFGFLPVAYANPDQDPFPDVSFEVFSRFILANFGKKISLSTVLVILFSMTNNPDLLNLHARQQHTEVEGENAQNSTGWIRALANALVN